MIKLSGSYLEKAAKGWHTNAQHSLSSLYAKGQGVPQDYQKAHYWYEQAAKQGDASAQYNLGRLYRDGSGVDKDFVKAHHWFRKGAHQGNTDALGQVMLCLVTGQGVPQNASHGYGYLLVLIALEPDNENNHKVKAPLLKQLSPKEIEEGEALAVDILKDIQASIEH